ncbi:hypothetical protein [Burkholderia stabilis]|uniref:Uncharacterized protein n=1 Tax=Burkholderia stabilis TaxID=95485 RepID=A0AAJ5T5D1_9BURK|nr:hypothetical protein [Burkholderia stabilis]VBB10670.1 hypothetical protein BSTAB16_0777 [Burkholderia stabilis]VBB13366.1 hypothetical protein BSTAB16_3551 [Burkholderia stabilis]
MNWLVLLAGTHWADVAPEFKLHESGAMCFTICEQVDMTGPLLKLVHRDGPAYVQFASVVAVLEAEDPRSQRAVGFTAKFDN